MHRSFPRFGWEIMPEMHAIHWFSKFPAYPSLFFLAALNVCWSGLQLHRSKESLHTFWRQLAGVTGRSFVQLWESMVHNFCVDLMNMFSFSLLHISCYLLGIFGYAGCIPNTWGDQPWEPRGFRIQSLRLPLMQLVLGPTGCGSF